MEEVLFSPTDYRVTETASLATLAGFGVVKKTNENDAFSFNNV